MVRASAEGGVGRVGGAWKWAGKCNRKCNQSVNVMGTRRGRASVGKVGGCYNARERRGECLLGQVHDGVAEVGAAFFDIGAREAFRDEDVAQRSFCVAGGGGRNGRSRSRCRGGSNRWRRSAGGRDRCCRLLAAQSSYFSANLGTH
jgi:hypothetical protein